MRTSLRCELFQLFSASSAWNTGYTIKYSRNYRALTLKTLRNFFRDVAEDLNVHQPPRQQLSALEAQNHEFEASRSDCHHHRQFIKWDWTSTAFVSSANKMKNRNKYRSFPPERVCVRSEIISRESGARCWEKSVLVVVHHVLIHCGESEPENCTKTLFHLKLTLTSWRLCRKIRLQQFARERIGFLVFYRKSKQNARRAANWTVC